MTLTPPLFSYSDGLSYCPYLSWKVCYALAFIWPRMSLLAYVWQCRLLHDIFRFFSVDVDGSDIRHARPALIISHAVTWRMSPDVHISWRWVCSHFIF